MEKFGFIRALDAVEEKGVKIAHITTDRHKSIRKYMREKRPDIDHEFDLWHVVKGAVNKPVAKAGKKAPCRQLNEWSFSISNHIWFSSQSCGGDPELLQEMWLSIMSHVRNVHQWDGNKKFHKCTHPPIPASQNRLKK